MMAVGMQREGSGYRLLAAALGAVLMAVSVYLPWYSIELTSTGAATVQGFGDQVAAQFGNSAMQSAVQAFHADVGKLVGTPLASVSAHQALSVIGVVLVVLAVLALLDALVPLARGGAALPHGAGGSLALLGLVACLLIGYRMISPPTLAGSYVSLSLREGAWLSLLGAATVLAAGLWPLVARPKAASGEPPQDVFSQLSGWSPQA
jgi:hypothetical protein